MAAIFVLSNYQAKNTRYLEIIYKMSNLIVDHNAARVVCFFAIVVLSRLTIRHSVVRLKCEKTRLMHSGQLGFHNVRMLSEIPR